jgi:hypothetical protein
LPAIFYTEVTLSGGLQTKTSKPQKPQIVPSNNENVNVNLCYGNRGNSSARPLLKKSFCQRKPEYSNGISTDQSGIHAFDSMRHYWWSVCVSGAGVGVLAPL